MCVCVCVCVCVLRHENNNKKFQRKLNRWNVFLFLSEVIKCVVPRMRSDDARLRCSAHAQ